MPGGGVEMFFCKPVTIFAKDSGAMLQAWLVIDKLVAEVWSLAPLQCRGLRGCIRYADGAGGDNCVSKASFLLVKLAT